MSNSFTAGMQMGMTAARARQDRDRQKVLDARAEEKWGYEKSALDRAQKLTGEEDEAFRSYQALQGGIVDGSKADFSQPTPGSDAGPVNAPAPVTGMKLPTREASSLDRNMALQRIAAARRDMGALNSLQASEGDLRDTDLFNSAVKKFRDDPASAQESLRWVNKNGAMPFAITDHYTGEGKARKKSGYQVLAINGEGDAKPIVLSQEQMARAAGAAALLDRNPAKALDILGKINGDLASSLAATNEQYAKVLNTNNAVTKNAKGDAINEAELEQSRQRTGIAAQGLTLQRDKANLDRMGSAQYMKDKDGNVFAVVPTMTESGMKLVTQKVNADDTKGMTPFSKTEPGIKVNADGSVVKDGVLYVPDPKAPGKYVAAKGIGPSALDKALEDMARNARPVQDTGVRPIQ